MYAIRWNPFNADESATLNSSEVSFYKGVPVFKKALVDVQDRLEQSS